ncbi:MAG: hypothetical protein R3Y57_01060 [Erysipelotrichaceae bacterium]
MVNQELRSLQPTIYQVIDNAFKQGRLAHSYLLTGNNPKLKLETAFFLAQSIVEGKLACESCNTCRRIKEKQYTDLTFIDGSQDTIKKEDIDRLQKHFMLSANEVAGKKIYIIHLIENTSIASLNSLLKFLEEPNGEDTYAILIAESLEKVLDTIISRCIVLNFKYQDPRLVQKIYQEHQTDELEAYYLSKTMNCYDETIVENEAFQSAFYFFKEWLKYYPNRLDEYLFDIHQELLVYKDKDLEMKTMKWLLRLVSIFLAELKTPYIAKQSWYNQEVARIQESSAILEDALQNTLSIKEKINKSYDYRLLMDRWISQLKGR